MRVRSRGNDGCRRPGGRTLNQIGVASSTAVPAEQSACSRLIC
jgi:hypothetical protein